MELMKLMIFIAVVNLQIHSNSWNEQIWRIWQTMDAMLYRSKLKRYHYRNWSKRHSIVKQTSLMCLECPNWLKNIYFTLFKCWSMDLKNYWCAHVHIKFKRLRWCPNDLLWNWFHCLFEMLKSIKWDCAQWIWSSLCKCWVSGCDITRLELNLTRFNAEIDQITFDRETECVIAFKTLKLLWINTDITSVCHTNFLRRKLTQIL